LFYTLSGDVTIADLLNGKEIYLSFITELEILGYNQLRDKDLEKIKDLLKECTIIDITEQIKECSILFRRRYKLKLPDCIIAATSQYLNIPLLTADKDFKNIENIDTLIYE
jgi:predicted nucleic acid-binding protein